ncbi:MAG: sigma-70 family RNA polymerase sigma factor [Candidatus Bilamarchaeaceae archaeon]
MNTKHPMRTSQGWASEVPRAIRDSFKRYLPMREAELLPLISEAKTNPQSMQKVVLHNLHLAYTFTNLRSLPFFAERAGLSRNDCFDIAVMGLIRAVKEFDVSKGRFVPFAFTCMRSEVYRRLTPPGITILDCEGCRRFEVAYAFVERYGNTNNAAFMRLERSAPAVAEIVRFKLEGVAPRTRVPKDTVFRSYLSAVYPESLPGSASPVIMVEPEIDAADYAHDFRKAFRLLNLLDSRTRDMVSANILDGETQASIAERYGFTKEWVRQIIATSMSRMREALENGKDTLKPRTIREKKLDFLESHGFGQDAYLKLRFDGVPLDLLVLFIPLAKEAGIMDKLKPCTALRLSAYIKNGGSVREFVASIAKRNRPKPGRPPRAKPASVERSNPPQSAHALSGENHKPSAYERRVALLQRLGVPEEFYGSWDLHGSDPRLIRAVITAANERGLTGSLPDDWCRLAKFYMRGTYDPDLFLSEL